MNASRCPVCKKPLGNVWKFCPFCESYFETTPHSLTGDKAAVALDYNELSYGYRKRRLCGTVFMVSIVAFAGLFAILAAGGGNIRHSNGQSDARANCYRLLSADEKANADVTLQNRMDAGFLEIASASGCAVHPGIDANGRPFFNLYLRRCITADKAQARADFAAHILSDIRTHFMSLDAAYDMTVTVYSPDNRPIAFSDAMQYRHLRKPAYMCAPSSGTADFEFTSVANGRLR